MSDHSSLSTGYNRFKFQPREVSKQKHENPFHYAARNNEKPFDASGLTKGNIIVGSRKSLDVLIPQRDSLIRLDSPRNLNVPQQINSKPVKDMARELKFLASSLKKAI